MKRYVQTLHKETIEMCIKTNQEYQPAKNSVMVRKTFSWKHTLINRPHFCQCYTVI